MSCFFFLSRVATSSMRESVPLTFTRSKPRRWYSANSFFHSPFRPRATGARMRRRVPSGIAMTRSTIWETVCASIGRPVAGE